MTNDKRQAWLEAALREGEIQLLHLIDAMPHMAWMASAEYGCEFVNQRWVVYAGVSVEEVLGAEWTKLVHPDDQEATYAAWVNGSGSDQPFQVYCRIRSRDGQYRWFDTRGVPLRNSKGRVVKWFGTNTDVHEAHEARQELAINEERLRYVSLASNDCVYDWDIRRGETYRNEAFQKFFGAPPIIRSSERWWEQRIHPHDRARIMMESAAAFAAGEFTWRSDYRLRRADGSYASVTDRAYLLYDDKRKPIRMIGAIADNTERTQIERSLRDVQARLLTAMDAAGMASWIWEIAKDELYWDDASFRLWGREPDEFDKLSFKDVVGLMHPDDRERIAALGAEFLRAGVELPVEFRTQRSDGALQWLMAKGVIERDPSGKPVRMVGVYIDITERKRVEQSLRDARARLLSVMEAGGLATWIWDVERNEITWDEAAYRLWGRQPQELGELTLSKVYELLHPDDRERVNTATEVFFRTGVERPTEFRTVRSDGKQQWLMTKGQIERDENGKPIRMVGVFLDITDRKRMEEAQLRSQKMEALGTLAGGIAHDFNNILLAIGGNAKLAVEDLTGQLPADHSVRRNLTEIERATARATDLVRRILAFSRQQDSKHEVVQLRSVIDEALRLLRPTLPVGVEIRTAFDTNAPPVEVDAIQVHQVIMNLVTNAAHAVGDRGSVEVRLDAHTASNEATLESGKLPVGEYARLTVSDTGVGIESAILDRIFDPFFTTKQAGKGTGLGLAVVHGIVEAHGGVVVVNSKLGQGSSFKVYFPAARTAPAAAETAPHRVLSRGRGERILYVDDEEPLVFLIANVLERLGYRVMGFVDPHLALAEFRALPNSFDAIVTDLSMPGMNGFELARAIRTVRGDIPVLLTSGYVRTEDRETARASGIRELILKPNTVEELGEAIDRALQSQREQ